MARILVLILSCFTSNVMAVSHSALEQMQTMRLTGKYQQALDLGHAEIDKGGGHPQLLNEIGELQLTLGKQAAAASRFQQVIDLGAEDVLMAQLNLAEVHRQKGEWQLAENLYVKIRSAYQTLPRLTARDLYAIASASRYLGRRDPKLFNDAVRIFDQASRMDPSFLDADIALGELLLEKYNNSEAQEVFTDVIGKNDEHPQALLGLAKSQHFDYSSEALQTTLLALEFNPGLVAARVFLSRLFIELEQYEEAEIEALKALEVNPVSLEALSMLAVVHYLLRDTIEFEELEKQVLALNPGYAGFYNQLAELAAQNRLYRQAQAFAAKAVELDPQSWRGHGLLGMNQFRLGDMQQGRSSLERSFSGDPYNVWIRNTLQLADSFKNYVKVESGQFEFVLHNDEQALLGEYIHELADQAYRHFEKRYRHQPPELIRVELYPEHADFSVRSVGLAGVGLLGVCFGPVVAMDSPAARERSAFNWGSTLWHELAHVFHLSITGNRVPRWFSEGLAVYEERVARPGWGSDVDPDFLIAYFEGRLLPLSELNNGFVRPSYPDQILHSYFQASLVFEFIEARWGFGVIRDMLYAFKHSTNPDAVVSNYLQLDAETLDTDFDNYLQQKYATALNSLTGAHMSTESIDIDEVSVTTELPDKYFDQIRLGNLLLEQGNLDLAEQFIKRAQQLFPEYAGDDSSYAMLASLYHQQGKFELAEQQLADMTAINAEHYDAQLQLAKLRARRDDHAGAAAALEAANYIYPYDPQLHESLAAHQAELGNWHEVARERRALLALNPVDKAEAHYQLAYAYHQAGNRYSARQQVLYALEIAPNFFRAQELLLSIRKEKSPAQQAQ
ncbi:MAG: tetratricopeptide repeat protein [Gammaproteobacteria bacterium]|nr:tetratricopeptide repeat protein [Gammaproteobacteria bacterium]